MENENVGNGMSPAEEQEFLEFKRLKRLEEAKATIAKLDCDCLSVYTDKASLKSLCASCNELGIGGLVVPPVLVKNCVVFLGEDPVCSLIAAISYPCGGDVTKIKVAAVKRAIADGVDEVEVCAPVFALREGNYAYFKKECKKLKKAAKGRALRIVIDWATLNDSQIGRVCAIAADCGVDMIRFSNMGDYSLISSVAGALKDKCLIKVDGAASYAQFQQGIVKGASVVGCVGGVEIAQTVMNLANNG